MTEPGTSLVPPLMQGSMDSVGLTAKPKKRKLAPEVPPNPLAQAATERPMLGTDPAMLGQQQQKRMY